jgi:hypothetical protein
VRTFLKVFWNDSDTVASVFWMWRYQRMDEPTTKRAGDGATEALADLIKSLTDSGHLARLLNAARHPGTSSTKQSAGSLAGDILHGAEGIAEFLYGDRKLRRKVYNLVETARLPHFRLGAVICARRSVLLDWIQAQERALGLNQ